MVYLEALQIHVTSMLSTLASSDWYAHESLFGITLGAGDGVTTGQQLAMLNCFHCDRCDVTRGFFNIHQVVPRADGVPLAVRRMEDLHQCLFKPTPPYPTQHPYPTPPPSAPALCC